MNLGSVAVNKKFYSEVFETWNQSPEYYWAGFWDLYPYLCLCFKEKTSVKVLDIGCANGRWFNFLEYCFPEIVFEKYGLDFIDFPFVNDFSFQILDITTPEFVDFCNLVINLKSFDLITMFGVYHHIQGQKKRECITKNLQNLMTENGTFIFTRWNFLLLERLRKHIIKPLELPDSIKIDLETWEKGDYYLKWEKGKYGIRFANFMDCWEIEMLLKAGSLKCIASFDADDKLDNRNTYFVTKILPVSANLKI
jgi:SAM-dependent methyltransferase